METNGKAPRRTQTRKPRQVRPTPRAGGGSDVGEDGKDYARSRRPDGKKKRPRAGEDDDEPRAYGASRFGVPSGQNRTDRDPLVRARARRASALSAAYRTRAARARAPFSHPRSARARAPAPAAPRAHSSLTSKSWTWAR